MRKSTINKAKSIIDARHNKALYNQTLLCDKLNTIPQWTETDRAIRRADLDISIARVSNSDTTTLIANRQKLEEQRNQLLEQYRLTPSNLLPQYHCTICNDTGSTQGNMCTCMKDVVRSIVIGDSTLLLGKSSFDNSTESNSHNIKVYSACKTLCDKIDSTSLYNVLLTGKTGTGKTHLLSCMANNLLCQGKEVVAVTAYHLNQQLLHMHMSSMEERTEYLDNINDIDILIIDDLGSENKYNNVTVEYLFGIINERIMHRRHTFLSTNLNLAQLQEKYGDRILSRLADKSITLSAQLIDKDKRTSKQ